MDSQKGAAGAANPRKVVLAYSGGLDTSVAIVWLKETYGCEVVCYCADLGQGEDLGAVAEKGMKCGASDVVVVDLRETFVKDYIFPMIQAGAIYEDGYLLGTSIARPLIAKVQMEIELFKPLRAHPLFQKASYPSDRNPGEALQRRQEPSSYQL
jgi:argininosuccinate synthase